MNKERDKKIWILQIGILILNSFSVMGISIFIYLTIGMICRGYMAREFLAGVQSIVWYPLSKIWMLALLLLLLTVSMLIRDRLFPDNNKVVLISLILDFGLCFIIIVLLNFNYNGILLLFFSNIIRYVKDRKVRYLLAAVAIGSFILADYELLSISYNLYSIHDYINYYHASAKQYLLSFYNILTSLNVILFVVYCINIINKQQGNIDEVHELNEQLKEYTLMAEKMAETRERNRLAREIHDTLGHTLTGISAGIDACIALLGTAPEQAGQQLEVIAKVTRNGIQEIRRSVNQLRPDALERLNLEYAINNMVAEINALSDVNVSFDCKMENLKFDEDEETAIYRVIQEGVTNAIRHGKAKQIQITIDNQYGEILLQIKDDGIGCKEIKKGFGIRHINERIESLCGVVTFDGSDGFTVNAKIPIRWGEKYD